jgi:gamma-glutamyltranspeptidase
MKAAINLGAEHIADPNESVGVADRLLGSGTAKAMREAVRNGVLGGRMRDQIGTACVLVADSKGNAACIVQSVFNVFGSGVLDPRTGVLFNNRMKGFDHRPDRPNTVGPGKRPAHTLCPVLVTKDSKPRYMLASPGGLSQTLINAQVLMNLIDGEADVLSAVESPRWAINSTGDIIIEPAFPPTVVADLANVGYEVKRSEDDYFYGSAKAIEFLQGGTLAGGADSRREAVALGL